MGALPRERGEDVFSHVLAHHFAGQEAQPRAQDRRQGKPRPTTKVDLSAHQEIAAKIASGQLIPVLEGVQLDNFEANTTPTHVLTLVGVKAREGEPGYGVGEGDVQLLLPANDLRKADGQLADLALLPLRTYGPEHMNYLKTFTGPKKAGSWPMLISCP